MRNIRLVDYLSELNKIDNLSFQLLASGLNASNSVIITVSSDYSSIVGQIIRHRLSFDGEVADGFSVDVPYPDEIWDKKYTSLFLDTLRLHAATFVNKKIILVEAAVIRGGNYKKCIELITKDFGFTGEIITAALFENVKSAFKSHFVAEYYNNDAVDLTFWWEQKNNHWQ